MRIALTSCSKVQQNDSQTVWRHIKAQDPSVLLLLGDTVYLDDVTGDVNEEPDWAGVEARYEQQFSMPGFRDLIQTPGIDVHAIWDDHDFHSNNVYGGDVREETIKRMKSVFFSRFPAGAPGNTIYYSREYDNLKLIFLDVRTFRKKDETILGKEQEDWLVSELEHDKKYTLVCSGSTLNSRGYMSFIGGPAGKRWKEHKPSYRWVRELLSNKGHSLFLAGDIHRTKFKPHVDDTFYEVISSGSARKLWFEKGHFATIDLADNVTVRLHKNEKVKKTIVIDGDTWRVIGKS